MIGGLTYEDFCMLWLEYEEEKATQADLDKAWADWSRQHTKG